MLHSRSCNESIEPLMLLCDLCHGSIEPGGILNVDLAVVDGTSELSDAFLSLVVFWRWFW
jgi:hypothetical protein